MSRLAKIVGAAALVAGAFTLTAGSAQAQWHHRHHHGGSGVYFSFGSPYAYAPGPYYGPACRYERHKIWRHGRWFWRTVRRCY